MPRRDRLLVSSFFCLGIKKKTRVVVLVLAQFSSFVWDFLSFFLLPEFQQIASKLGWPKYTKHQQAKIQCAKTIQQSTNWVTEWVTVGLKCVKQNSSSSSSFSFSDSICTYYVVVFFFFSQKAICFSIPAKVRNNTINKILCGLLQKCRHFGTYKCIFLYAWLAAQTLVRTSSSSPSY